MMIHEITEKAGRARARKRVGRGRGSLITSCSQRVERFGNRRDCIRRVSVGCLLRQYLFGFAQPGLKFTFLIDRLTVRILKLLEPMLQFGVRPITIVEHGLQSLKMCLVFFQIRQRVQE